MRCSPPRREACSIRSPRDAEGGAPSQSSDRLAEPAKPHYLGHRDRARDRFNTVGGDTMQDYELLELLLHQMLPRRDTKALAKPLIAKFGSFSEVLGASPQRLGEVKGLGDTSVTNPKIIQAVAQRYGRDQIVRDRPVLGSWTALIDYCRSQMAYETKEQFRILFLDKKNQLITDEVQQTGTVNTPRSIRAR
jgi:DNA repair protein RadC